jgi:hypothetical protein
LGKLAQSGGSCGYDFVDPILSSRGYVDIRFTAGLSSLSLPIFNSFSALFL